MPSSSAIFDLSHFRDFSTIKDKFDSVDRSFTTIYKPYQAHVSVGKHARKFSIYLVDTRNLVPATARSVDQLGRMHGFEKLDPGKQPDGVPYIARMDRLLKD